MIWRLLCKYFKYDTYCQLNGGLSKGKVIRLTRSLPNKIWVLRQVYVSYATLCPVTQQTKPSERWRCSRMSNRNKPRERKRKGGVIDIKTTTVLCSAESVLRTCRMIASIASWHSPKSEPYVVEKASRASTLHKLAAESRSSHTIMTPRLQGVGVVCSTQ